MLKDITLGQYFPGDTVVHRLDPRTKLILVVVYIVALFQAAGWWSYGAVTAVTLFANCCHRRRDCSTIRSGRPCWQRIIRAWKEKWPLSPLCCRLSYSLTTPWKSTATLSDWRKC